MFVRRIARRIKKYNVTPNWYCIRFARLSPERKVFIRLAGICNKSLEKRINSEIWRSSADDVLRHLTVRRLLPHSWPPSSPFNFRLTHETLWTHTRPQIRLERPVGSIHSLAACNVNLRRSKSVMILKSRLRVLPASFFVTLWSSTIMQDVPRNHRFYHKIINCKAVNVFSSIFKLKYARHEI